MTQHDDTSAAPGSGSGTSPKPISPPAPPASQRPAHLGAILDRRPRGAPGLVKAVEERLACVAVVAAGVRGAGPWRLASARWDRIKPAIATLNQGNWLRIEAGAVVMVEADTWAKRVMEAAEAEARRGTALEAPWFLSGQDDLEPMLLAAAKQCSARAWSWAAYCTRVEGEVERMLRF